MKGRWGVERVLWVRWGVGLRIHPWWLTRLPSGHCVQCFTNFVGNHVAHLFARRPRGNCIQCVTWPPLVRFVCLCAKFPSGDRAQCFARPFSARYVSSFNKDPNCLTQAVTPCFKVIQCPMFANSTKLLQHFPTLCNTFRNLPHIVWRYQLFLKHFEIWKVFQYFLGGSKGKHIYNDPHGF